MEPDVTPLVGRRRGAWPWVTALAALSLAFGLYTGSPTLDRAAYLLAGLLVLCPLYAFLSLRSLRLEHSISTIRVVAGERVLEVYRVRARALWPVWGVGIAAGSYGWTDDARPRWTLALAPRGHEELAHVSRAGPRGRYRVGAAAVHVSDPFGVVVARRCWPSSGEVVVWPRPRAVPQLVFAAARAGELLAARRSWASSPVSGAVRPYTQGDSSTRIHWLSSARHGSLMVKDSDRSVGQRLWVALDLESPAHAGVGADSTVEYGVEAAAYVAERADKTGFAVGLAVAGAAPIVTPARRGRAARARMLDVLAEAAPRLAGTGGGLGALLVDERVVRPADGIVLITPYLTPELLDLAVRWRRLGCGVSVVLLDAESFGGVGAGGATTRGALAALDAARIPACILACAWGESGESGASGASGANGADGANGEEGA